VKLIEIRCPWLRVRAPNILSETNLGERKTHIMEDKSMEGIFISVSSYNGEFTVNWEYALCFRAMKMQINPLARTHAIPTPIIPLLCIKKWLPVRVRTAIPP